MTQVVTPTPAFFSFLRRVRRSGTLCFVLAFVWGGTSWRRIYWCFGGPTCWVWSSPPHPQHSDLLSPWKCAINRTCLQNSAFLFFFQLIFVCFRSCECDGVDHDGLRARAEESAERHAHAGMYHVAGSRAAHVHAVVCSCPSSI